MGRRARIWTQVCLAPESESSWPLHLRSFITSTYQPAAPQGTEWSSFICTGPASSKGFGTKQEPSKDGEWMPHDGSDTFSLSKKVAPEMLQDAPHRSQPDQLSPAPGQNVQTTYSSPSGLLLYNPTPREGGAAILLRKGAVGVSKLSSSLLHLSFFLPPHLILEHLKQTFLSSPIPKT